QQSALYYARATAGGIDPERRITTGVCYCCKTAVAIGRDGSVAIAWRQVYPGNVRDIAFTRSADGRAFAPPIRVSVDQWQLDGCPDDGPALAIGADGRTHIAWPTLVAERSGGAAIALFYARSSDGRRFTPR